MRLIKSHCYQQSRRRKSFLTCTFCFLTSDHVMFPQRTVSSKFSRIHVHMYAKFLKRQKVKSLENIMRSDLVKQNIQARALYQKAAVDYKLNCCHLSIDEKSVSQKQNTEKRYYNHIISLHLMAFLKRYKAKTLCKSNEAKLPRNLLSVSD